MDSHPPQERWKAALEHLEEKKTALQSSLSSEMEGYAGLIDLDTALALTRTRLTIALTIMEMLPHAEDSEGWYERACTEVREGVLGLEDLGAAGVSEDQRYLVSDHPDYEQCRELVQQLVLGGGAPFFERSDLDPRRERLVVGVVADALRRFAPPDDRYERLIRVERLPRILRAIAERVRSRILLRHSIFPLLDVEKGRY